ncbi:hypothetical protein BH10ACT10_BH10ACT10_20570 [soil metagenome]
MTSPADPSAPARWDAEAFRAAIQSALDVFVDEQAGRLEPLGDDAARLVSAARASVSGGKRFRAAFCLWGFRSVRDEGPEGAALVRAAAALEGRHAGTRVHDGCVDASDTRRPRPASHNGCEARRLYT